MLTPDIDFIQDPFHQIVLPINKRYVEVAWFADENVAVTNETASATPSLGWTDGLMYTEGSNGKPLIQPHKKGGKYIELERMLSSIVFLYVFKDGSRLAYEKFTSLQKSEEKLTWDSFVEIHKFVNKVAGTNELFQALEAMLVFSDAGKTPTAVRKAENYGLRRADHDDFIEALLHQKKEVINQVLPSFESLSADMQDLLIQISSAMPIHLGHVLHIEGGEQMFSKFEKISQENKVNKRLLDFAFLIQLCDVAASAAHVNKEGSLALTENTYRGYLLVKEALESMLETEKKKGKNKTEALFDYVRLRGELMGADTRNDVQAQFLVRMACWMRLYTAEDYGRLQKAMEALPENARQVVLEQFKMDGGFNTWARNPTYGPAVLVNLANFQNHQEDRQLKINRALEGACCLAIWAKTYESSMIPLTTPVNFNAMAGLAAKEPEKFSINNFNPLDFEPNEKNEVIFKKKGQPRLTWAKDAEDKKQNIPETNEIREDQEVKSRLLSS